MTPIRIRAAGATRGAALTAACVEEFGAPDRTEYVPGGFWMEFTFRLGAATLSSTSVPAAGPCYDLHIVAAPGVSEDEWVRTRLRLTPTETRR